MVYSRVKYYHMHYSVFYTLVDGIYSVIQFVRLQKFRRRVIILKN